MEQTTEQTQAHPPRRLYRRRADRMIAGVAVGLADYFGIDPIWVRLAFVLTAFAGGIGLIAYAALWVLAPVSDEPSPVRPVEARRIASRFASSTTGTILIVIGALMITTILFDSRPELFWGAALVVLGVFLFREREPERFDHTPQAEVLPPGESGDVAGTAMPAAEGAALPPASRARAVPAPAPPRPRSPLGVATLGAAIVAMGGMWLVDQSSGVSFRPVQYFAVALLIMGAGLCIGAFVGRARWLIIPATLLVPMTLAASLITLPFEGGIGEPVYMPTTFEEVQPEYRLAAGVIRLDLSGVAVEQASIARRVEMTVPLGGIEVAVPPDVPVAVRARVGAGAIAFEGVEEGGIDMERTRSFGPEDVAPVILLDLQVSLGQITVVQGVKP